MIEVGDGEVIVAAVELVGPWLTKIALDRAIPDADVRLLMTLSVVYLAALLAGFVLQYAQTIITAWLGQRVMVDLRRQIFAKLQRLDLPGDRRRVEPERGVLTMKIGRSIRARY